MDVAAAYRSHGHSVLRRAQSILGNRFDAEEILQEIFVGLAERPQQFEGKSSLATFLYAATTNACLTRIRKQQNRARIINNEFAPWRCEVDRPSTQYAVLVRELLADVPAIEAAAAIYHYCDGMIHAEIADVLGCSRRHVGNLLLQLSCRIARKEAV